MAARFRFTALLQADVWTVRDRKERRCLTHRATWDGRTAQAVADSLNANPGHVEQWTWAPCEAVGKQTA